MESLKWLTKRPIAHRGLHDGNKSVWENTLAAYSRAMDANYAEAYYGMGLSFFGDEKTFQDGANYLQFFIDKAAATDPRVAEAKGAITQMNLKPSKDALNALKKDAGAKPAPAAKKKSN